MKTHIRVDVASCLVHTVVGTADNVVDITQTAAMLHGEKETVFGYAGYSGPDKRSANSDRHLYWNVAIKGSIIKALLKTLQEIAKRVERALSEVRAMLEHPFHISKI